MAANWAEMGTLSSKNRGLEYLLCLIDGFIKYAWVKPLKDKKAKSVLNGGVVNESKRKSNKLWVNQRKTFCNNLIRKSLDDKDLSKNSTHYEAKSVVADRFIRNLN